MKRNPRCAECPWNNPGELPRYVTDPVMQGMDDAVCITKKRPCDGPYHSGMLPGSKGR